MHLGKVSYLSTILVLISNSTSLAQTATPTPKPRNCVVGVNYALRELNSSARQCKNAKDNVTPLSSKKTNVLYGSADDLFNLSLDRIAATPEQLLQIEAAEREVQSARDSLLNDLNLAIEESSTNAAEVCQEYSSDNAEYNRAVASCSRAKKKTVTLSCNVSLRYSKRDAKAAKDRCTAVTKLATATPTRKTSTLAELDAIIARYRAQLEKATNDATQQALRDAIAEATAQRAKEVQYFDAGIALINAYKATTCNESSTQARVYANLVKDCAKK